MTSSTIALQGCVRREFLGLRWVLHTGSCTTTRSVPLLHDRLGHAEFVDAIAQGREFLQRESWIVSELRASGSRDKIAAGVFSVSSRSDSGVDLRQLGSAIRSRNLTARMPCRRCLCNESPGRSVYDIRRVRSALGHAPPVTRRRKCTPPAQLEPRYIGSEFSA